jgi:hypothetical protein
MANRVTDLDQKVAAMRECLTLREVAQVMEKYGFSERSAWHWLAQIKEALPEVLASERPGPKPRTDAAPPL